MENYVLVWIEEEEKWYYLKENEFNEDKFPNGFVSYDISVKDGIITYDDYNKGNCGKLFTDVYGTYFKN